MATQDRAARRTILLGVGGLLLATVLLFALAPGFVPRAMPDGTSRAGWAAGRNAGQRTERWGASNRVPAPQARSATALAGALLVQRPDAEGETVFVERGHVGRLEPGRLAAEGAIDSRGEKRFAELRPGPYTVWALRGGRATVDVTVEKLTTVRLPRPCGGELTVEVVDENGQAVAGAEVLISANLRMGTARAVGRTDCSGRLVLAGVGGLRYATVRLDGYALAVPRLLQPTGDHGRLRFVLRQGGGRVSGRLCDAVSGTPAAGWIALCPGDRTTRIPPVATDGYGRFVVSGVLPGTYVLEASCPRAASKVVVEVGSKQELDLLVPVWPLRVLRGCVRYRDGTPASGVVVRAGDLDDLTSHATSTGEDGCYAIEGIASGPLRVTAVADETSCSDSLVVTPNSAAPVEWSPRLQRIGALRCRVVDTAGHPVEGLLLHLLRDGDELRVCRSGPDGFGLFRQVRAGDYDIQVGTVAGVVLFERLHVRPGRAAVAIELDRAAALARHLVGRVVDENGAAVRSYWLQARNLDGSVASRIAVADSDGRLRVTGLPPGRTEIVLGARGYATIHRVLRLPVRGEASLGLLVLPH